MTKTEYLNLQSIELEKDKKVSGRTYLEMFSGTGSNNLGIIDKNAKDVAAELKRIKESPSTVFVNATEETEGYYTATVPSIPSSMNDLIVNGIYILKLNTTNTTTNPTIKINGRITKELRKIIYDVNQIGVLSGIDIGDIGMNSEFPFRYDGTFLVLVGSDSQTFQRKRVKDFVLKNEVVDALDSVKNDVPLSAKQGKCLNDTIADNKTITDKVIADNKTAIENTVATHISTATAAMKLKADLIDGLVPSAQLPSYVDDVIEFESKSMLPAIGEQGKIYVIYGDINDKNNGQYRWSGTVYNSITKSLDYATKAEAELGSENSKVMTPLRVKESIQKNSSEVVMPEVDEKDAITLSSAKTYTDEKISKAIQIIPTTITGSLFVDDTTYVDYPFRATVSIPNLTANDSVDLNLNVTSGEVAVAAEMSGTTVSAVGAIYLYTKNVPTATLIGNLVVTKGGV